jgi:pyruvate ferredoxin oxidoreductase alpha subunit
MKGNVISSTDAAAYAAKMSFVESVPNFPAPFSVDITKKLEKIHNCDIFEVESASSAVSSAIGASMAGKRVLLPSSSPLTYEAFYAPYTRLPFVIVNVSRSQHGPQSDHSSVMALRDSGYLMFFPESNQEIHDTIIQAYRIAEDPKVMLPAIVNIDGPSNYTEVIQLSTEQSTKGMLQKFNPKRIDLKKPMSNNIISEDYSNLKLQQQKAMENALGIIQKTDEKWKQKFRRSYGLVEHFMTEDASTIIVISGYHSSTAKAAVKKMREEGRKVGVLRIRVFRPWPKDEMKILDGKKVVVFDQSVSLGRGGVLSTHIKGSSVISLGKYPSEKDFTDIVNTVEKAENDIVLWL